MAKKIYLSYSKGAKIKMNPETYRTLEMVKRAHECLTVVGHDAYLDIYDYTGGLDQIQAIHTSVFNAKVMVVFVTEDYLSDRKCEEEMQIAFNEKKPLIPVYLEDVAPELLSGIMRSMLGKALLQNYDWIDFQQNPMLLTPGNQKIIQLKIALDAILLRTG